MRKINGVILSLGVVFVVASAAEWSGEWKPMKASYTIYSGELAEREAPTASQRTMTVAIEGPAAKEVFDSIAPDIRPLCSQEKGDRERQKVGVDCIYSRKGSEYRCWIGLNLRTGESIPTVSC